MGAVESGIAVVDETFQGLWGLTTANPLLAIAMFVGLVGVGIGIFFSLKSRLAGGKKRGRR